MRVGQGFDIHRFSSDPTRELRLGLVTIPDTPGLDGHSDADVVVHAIVDALDEADLKALGKASADLPLVTGGSGAAMGLPENFRRAGLLPPRQAVPKLAPAGGHAAVLSGSCSRAY